MYRLFFPKLATSPRLRTVTRRPPVSPATPPEAGHWERWSLYIGSGTTYAWFHPAPGTSQASPGPAVIFGHGGWDLVEDWFGNVEPYLNWGVSVLLPEYRGYGKAAGRPVETAVIADLTRFRNRLAERSEVDANRIVYHGRSIGGGMMAGLATRRSPAALILQSTFSSLPDLARSHHVPPFLVRDTLDNVTAIRRLTCPCLILHGAADRLVPVEHAHRLHEALPSSRLVIFDDVGHNDSPGRKQDLENPVTATRWHRFWSTIHVFLKDAGVLDPEQALDLPGPVGLAAETQSTEGGQE